MISRQGSMLVFWWGPPWYWLPRFDRSQFCLGWSVQWLWFGVALVPMSVGEMALRLALHRALFGHDGMDRVIAPLTTKDKRRLLRLCRASGGLDEHIKGLCCRCGLAPSEHEEPTKTDRDLAPLYINGLALLLLAPLALAWVMGWLR